MANSRYEYVKVFERADKLLPNTWIVVRIDGRGFTKMCAKYEFEKPNDSRGIGLMNAAAVAVMKDIPDIVLAYGVSDEFSFLFPKECELFDRRESKIVSTIVSTFSAYYVHLWLDFFPDYKLSAPLPSFDGRAVLYPDLTSVRDYFSWRQVDCHINNLYNTTFWHLVLKGDMSAIDAEARLSGTLSAEKNEILFSQFGVNYNREPEIYKKGSVIFRDLAAPTEKKKSKEGDLSARAMEPENVSSTEAAVGSSKTTSTDTETNVDDGQDTSALTPMTAPKSCPAPVKSESQIKESTKRLASSTPKPKSKTAQLKAKKLRQRAPVVVEHIDIIQDEFWKRRPWILSPDDFSLE